MPDEGRCGSSPGDAHWHSPRQGGRRLRQGELCRKSAGEKENGSWVLVYISQLHWSRESRSLRRGHERSRLSASRQVTADGCCSGPRRRPPRTSLFFASGLGPSWPFGPPAGHRRLAACVLHRYPVCERHFDSRHASSKVVRLEPIGRAKPCCLGLHRARHDCSPEG
jgi:hypothetical protein